MAENTAPVRKNIRLPAERYLGQQMYFVTLCFHQRRRFGANPRIARWLISRLQKRAAICEFHIHAYCVMPDHMHALAEGETDTSNLIKFVEAFKQETAIEFSQRAHRRLWQLKYYDHILRAADSFEGVLWYIWLNPVRKGLCAAPAEYPFLGSFTIAGAALRKGVAATQWVSPRKLQTTRPR